MAQCADCGKELPERVLAPWGGAFLCATCAVARLRGALLLLQRAEKDKDLLREDLDRIVGIATCGHY